MLMVHFAKRTLECLLLHKYSGDMPLASSITISSLYLTETFVGGHFAVQVGPLVAGNQRMPRWSLPGLMGSCIFCR